MRNAIDGLVKSFLQKESLEECSIQELQLLSRRHPYSATAQLLLAEKMKAGNANAYNEQFQKTTLYFHNPLWMDQLLQAKGDAMIHTRNKEIRETPPFIPLQETEPVHAPADDAPVEEPAIHNEIVPVDEPVQTLPQPVFDETADNPEPVIDQTTKQEQLHEERLREVSLQEEMHQEEPVPAKEEIPIPSLKIEAIDPATAELSFQPYHTVDYFASQGIKFREEDRPKDKFGQQLKSFTEWLKTLKKAPTTEMTVSENPQSERKVEQMAQHSVSDREVLTEAMAEVWEKQGNTEKAILIYSKLSLLNPSKSSYFAAKIEQLKTT
jgi:hypothetical protein